MMEGIGQKLRNDQSAFGSIKDSIDLNCKQATQVDIKKSDSKINNNFISTVDLWKRSLIYFQEVQFQKDNGLYGILIED
uniref:Uncharacterized protein n=1 Tax=Caenorhabditis brenneri TaxID=135651 RepID=B6VBM7_CAEBE|nr:hypothetical protein Cbre_JD14.008 [Caenorhabditis brenneri]